jgi:hypothetical protein
MADLVTLAEVNVALPHRADDARLSAWIAAASAAVRAWCGRQALGPPEVVTQTLIGTGGDLIHLSEWPVLIDEDATFAIVTDGTAVDDDSYTLYTDAGRVVRTDGTFALGSESVLTYTAGYTTVPEEVKQAVYLTIEELATESSSDRDLIELRHRDYTEKYATRRAAGGIVPRAARILLRRLRRRALLV